ncbi:MAG: lipopolysaccharide transport periplasmic protein LptA [Pseudomonadales bacterium]|nr:lipopolysaccharide transport periplasmic protein LptA [Pseudomonadales bacterium]
MSKSDAPIDKLEYPIHIEADSAVFNEQKGTTEYQGAVVMQQGPVQIEADRITISNDENGVVEMIAIGNPAQYKQDKTETSPLMSAKADRIHYYKIDERMELDGHAVLNRDNQLFSAPHIEYLIEQNTLKAHSDPSGNQNERVRMVIPPRSLQ